MASHVLKTRRPAGQTPRLEIVRDPAVLESLLEDAAHFPGGHATGVAYVRSEADVAAALALGVPVLPIGAQSSLTGGATPMGELLLSTARMNRILEIAGGRVRAEPGVTLFELDEALRERDLFYPPAPTYTGACIGGTVATNAAGAATFKYGATRDWVEALTVVLASGDVLDIERGTTRAHRDGYFDLVASGRTTRIPVPAYRMPDVPKVSAGYFAAPGIDAIDLFIGSEGTLGIITEVTVRAVSPRPAVCLALVTFDDRAAALQFVQVVRTAARHTWRTRDPRGLDLSAIEHMDARCLALLADEGADRRAGVVLPSDAVIALLITIDLAPGTRREQAFEDVAGAREAEAPDVPLVRFCRALDEAGVLDDTQLALPGDSARAAQFIAFREAVPAAVNQRVGRAKQEIDASIEKIAGDAIVPFERLAELMDFFDAEFTRRGLDYAVWGHISDGNLHPNVLPRSSRDVEQGKAAILECGRAAIRLGGSPLAEHGVGRNRVKRKLLQELYGESGIEQMRRVKRALDPRGLLSPGTLFTG